MLLSTVARTIASSPIFFIALTFVAQAAEPGQPYPPAMREATTEMIHGIEAADPYRWMENTGSAELERWVKAQNQLTRDSLPGDLLHSASSRIEELATYDLGFGGKRRGDRFFYMLRPGGGSLVELVVREGDKTRQLLTSAGIPDNEFANRFIGGRGFVPSHWPDRSGDMLAYIYTDGTERARIRVLDANSGRHLPDVIDEVSVSTVLGWSATGDGFYYFRTRLARSAGATETKRVRAGLWFHRLGTSQADDVAIIGPMPDDRRLFVPAVTTDGDRLVVMKRLGAAPVMSYLVFETDDLDATPITLFEQADARFIYLGSNGTRLYFQTNFEAPNGRVVAVDLLEPEQIEEIVAESGLPMLAGSNVGGDVLGFVGGHLVLGYLEDGLTDIRVYNERGTFMRSLRLPQGSSIWGALDSTPGATSLTVSLLNPFSPGHIVSLDVVNGEVRDEVTADVPVDADSFVVKRVFATSKDGTRIPMSVVHRKDVQINGDNPALVYGYGMHKWVSLLFYQAHIVHWLELGGVYAMPAIRGGGEYGDKWHDAGIKTNRQNAIDDFVAAGQWLVDNKYTSTEKLAANGGSASGALAGIVAVRYDDVFAATTVDYPIADLVRAPLYGNGANLVDEYGSLNEPDEGRALLFQSPYHQVRDDQCLIPSLIMVGEADKVALPLHGYKLAAAMQHSQSCDEPVLLYRMPDTGHNYGLSAKSFAENTAVQIVFLRTVLNF